MRELDYGKVRDHIVEWIRSIVHDSGAKGLVVGVSGGVDSAVVLALSVLSVGRENVYGLVLPEKFTPNSDIEDARNYLRHFPVKYNTVGIHDAVDSFEQSLRYRTEWKSAGKALNRQRLILDRITLANLRARVRMVYLYIYANSFNYLVAGTGDKSEDLIGYFTKYGDGGVDFLPIADLYKTEVRKLGTLLKVPPGIVNKPSSPQLYPGHKASDELPAEYAEIDEVLYRWHDQGMDVVGELADELIARYSRSLHKREYPPICTLKGL